jgi:Na+-translocating ferredoxin:NAD+ oxidoreductase RnfA subunit
VTNHIVIANDFVLTHVCPFLGVNGDIEFTSGVGGIAN